MLNETKNIEKTSALAQLFSTKKSSSNTDDTESKDDTFSLLLQNITANDTQEPEGKKAQSLLSQLLNSKDTKKDVKDDKNDLLEITIPKSEPKLTLSELLQSPQLKQEEKSDLAFITLPSEKKLTIKEVKQLISDAKSFLKDKLAQFSQDLQEKKLPNKLSSLVKLAKKHGLNIEKIDYKYITEKNTLNQTTVNNPIKDNSQLQLKPLAKNEHYQIHTKKDNEDKISSPLQKLMQQKEVPQNIQATKKETIHKKEVPQNIQATKKETKSKATLSHSIQNTLRESEKDSNVNTQRDLQKEPNTQEKIIKNSEQNIQINSTQTQNTTKQSAVLSETVQNISKEIKKEHIKNSTHKIEPSIKTSTSTKATHKQDAPTTLQSILATLHNEKKDEIKSSESKLETPHIIKENTEVKSDSLENKISEAKQLVKHFSTNLKEAADNYKSPFTRLSMKLNPEKLGDVSLTMIQRGKNLHINISSNDKAITMLSQNVIDLKTQLSHVGIQNATMNFNGISDTQSANQTNQQNSSQQNSANMQQNSSQNGSQSNAQQQGNQQQHKQQHYQEFIEEEAQAQKAIELEIILPRYI